LVNRRGEPLLNIPAVVAAASFLKEQIGLSGRALTISTVGVPNAIAKLAQHQLTATLAVSIHAPNQELREALIPSAKVYPLQVCVFERRGQGQDREVSTD
jgi:23S rRNA (adenine2503-C2)-methyltransferase